MAITAPAARKIIIRTNCEWIVNIGEYMVLMTFKKKKNRHCFGRNTIIRLIKSRSSWLSVTSEHTLLMVFRTRYDSRVLAIYRCCWIGVNICYETDEFSPATQGQPNLKKKKGLKVAFGPLFPTASSFTWVGIDFI